MHYGILFHPCHYNLFEYPKSNDIAIKYLSETIDKQDYLDNNYTQEEYSIKKTIKRSEKYKDCLIIKIEVYDIYKKKLSEVQNTKYAE